MGELDPLLINFLKLDGSNADQNIDIGAWDFITTGDLFASNLTLTNNLTVNGDILANDTLFFSEDTTYIKRSAFIPIRWQFVTNRNMQWSADDIDMVATGDMTVTSDGDTTFSSTAGNIVFQANGAGNSIDFSSENGSVTVNSAMADTDILLYNTNKLLMSIIGDVDGINFFDDVSITGSVSSTNYISDVATGTSPYACTSTTVNTNLNSDMLDGKHVGTSGNTVPLLDGVNDWSGTNRYKEDVTISGDTKDDEKDLLIRSIHKVGFVTWKGSTIQFFDEAANRGSIWYKDCAGGLGIDDLTGLHLKSATDITLNANDGAAAITLNGLTVWRDDVTIGLGKPGTGSERFLLYANDNNGYLNPSGWGIGALVHPVSFIYNDGQEDTDFIMKGDTNANLFTLDAGNNNITINAASVSAHYDLMLAGDGVLGLKETATPTADTNYGKIYCKDTNKIFFQDGAGVEHELAYV